MKNDSGQNTSDKHLKFTRLLAEMSGYTLEVEWYLYANYIVRNHENGQMKLTATYCQPLRTRTRRLSSSKM